MKSIFDMSKITDGQESNEKKGNLVNITYKKQDYSIRIIKGDHGGKEDRME